MAKASGKYAQAISDRSGMAFPYKEMIKEWNGSLVHKTEFEAKHQQLLRVLFLLLLLLTHHHPNLIYIEMNLVLIILCPS